MLGGSFPKGPSTQYLRSLVPNTIKSMVFGTRNLKYWVLGPSGLHRGSFKDTILKPRTSTSTEKQILKGCWVQEGLGDSLRPSFRITLDAKGRAQ